MQRYKPLFSLDEGLNDKHLFRSIFTAGGPGSGKSVISSMLFGIEKDAFTSSQGIKVVNSDLVFEMNLRKFDLPFIMDQNNEDVYAQQQKARGMAKSLVQNITGHFINGMLPLLIDGTGRDFKKISSQVSALRNIGYDCYMIFVNTSKEVALERNRSRPRQVDEQLVVKFWDEVQNNMGRFQKFFGTDNFYVIDNNHSFVEGSPDAHAFVNDLYKLGMKILKRPLKSPIGNKVITTLTQSGGKLLSDLEWILEDRFTL